MIAFPNVKINLGLNVTSRREDGYHDIDSVFYPVPFKDALEIVPAKEFSYQSFGIEVTQKAEENLVMKAWKLIQKEYELPSVFIALLKNIPAGTGLGGGSSDAAHMIRLINDVFKLELTTEKMEEFAGRLGSDCPFFIRNKPAHVTGRGERLIPMDIDLSGYHITIALPEVHISTAEAYQNIKPAKPAYTTAEIVGHSITTWKGMLRNDFEEYAFNKYPILQEIKAALYESGAMYASMTGSGSAIFGIADKKTDLKLPGQIKVWHGML